MLGVQMVGVRYMSVMGRLMMVTSLMMSCRLVVMGGCVLAVLSRLLVMLCCFFVFHDQIASTNGVEIGFRPDS